MWKQQNPPPAPLSNPHRDLLLSDTSTTAGSSAPLSMVEEGSSRTPSDPVNRDRNSAQVPPAPIVSDGDDDDEVILHDFTPERSADKNPIPPPPPSTSENDSATPEQKIHQNTQKNSATSDSRKDDKGEEEDVATPLSPPPNNTGPVFTCDVDETTKEILGGGSDSESEEMVLLFGDEDSKDDGGLDKFLDGKKNDAPVTPANSVGSPMSLPSPSPSPAKERTPVKREWARVGITPWRRPSSIRSPAIDPGTADTPTSKPDTTKHETNLDLTTPEAADTPKSSEDRAKPPVSPVRLSRVVKGKDVDESDVDTRVKCLGCGFICADIKICIEHLRTRHGIQDQVALQSCLSTLVSGGDDEPEPPMSVISEFSDDEASVLQRPSSLEKLSVGDKVVIVSGGNIPDMLVPAALKGVIVKIHPDKTADINNEEGELTEHVPLAELRRSLGEIQQLNSLRFLQSFESVQNIKELVKKKNKKATPAKRKSSRRSSVSKAVSKQTTPLKSNNGKKKADSSEDEQSGEGAMPPTPGLPKDEREQMRRVLCQVKKFFDILLSMEATAELLDFESRIFRALRDYNKHNQSPKTVTLRRQHPDDSWGLKLQCHSQLRCCGWTSAMRLSIVSIAQKCKRTGKATPASLQKKLKPGLLVWYVDGTVCRSEEDFISRASSGLEMQLQVLRIGRVAKKKDKRHVRDMFRLQTYHQALLSANAGLHYARDPKWIRKLLSFQN